MSLRSLLWWIDCWRTPKRYLLRWNPDSSYGRLCWGIYDLAEDRWVGDRERFKDIARRGARELNRWGAS